MNGTRTDAVQIPPELLRSTPREVTLTRTGKALVGMTIGMLIGALALAIGLYIGAVRGAERGNFIREQSVLTQGRVVGWGPVREGKRAVRYSFEADGREYAGHAALQSRHWRALPVGAGVAVRYLPADPQQSWIAGHEPKGIPFFVVGVAPLSMLFGPLILAYTLRRERALLAEGRPAVARVKRIRRVHGKHGDAGYRVWYEFSDLSGAQHTGRGNMGKNVPPEGSPLIIVYAMDEPRRSAPYPFPRVRVAVP